MADGAINIDGLTATRTTSSPITSAQHVLSGSPLPRRRRSWPVLAVFALIVACQVLVAVFSIDLLSAVRSYVSGESLYSKGQKDAHIYLIDYAEYRREVDYQRFLRAIAAPLSYRVVREELQKPYPDYERARQGYLGGGTHPSEVPGVIRLFRWFHRTPLMADAIATWSQGDAVIEQMRVLGAQAHDSILAGDMDAPAVTGLRDRAVGLNRRLTELEVSFAAQLSEAARLTQQLLLGLNLALALLLGVTGLLFVRHSARIQLATENEVRRRQESLQRLLDSAAEGLYGVNTDGLCTFINRAALSMLRYESESELLGQSIQTFLLESGARDGAEPDGSSTLANAHRASRELHLPEATFLRKDGSCFPAECWSHPMFKDGRLEGAVVTVFDISERLRMQAALRHGELRMASLIDAVNDGVITTGPDGRIVQFNPAAEQLFQVAARDVLGSPVDRFMRVPFSSDERQAPSHAVQELTGIRSDGVAIPLEVTFSSLDTQEGPFRTAVLRDVTELQAARRDRQAREALEAANQAKTDFLSRMSHELRTPLNAVLGFSQLLRLDSTKPPSAQQLKRIQHIENAGSHLLALVNDVLDLSRVEAGKLPMSLEAVDVNSVAEDAIAMVLPLATDAGIDVRIGAAEGYPLTTEVGVLADRVRLRQILVNLLSNAVKYNRPKGEVRLSWTIGDECCILRISDTGYGMSAEKLTRLFEPFNRLGAERSQIEGTGIGLVLSRRLAELMGGDLRLESTLGQGTVAVLELERSDLPSEAPCSLAHPSQHGDLDDKLHVLYAEDNEVNVELVRGIVALRPSVAMDVAANGLAAIAMARRNPPDLMLVDMNLGDMTGIEVAEAMKTTPSTAGVRLIALSADALPEQIRTALDAGFEEYLTKPINFRELLNALDRQIEQ